MNWDRVPRRHSKGSGKRAEGIRSNAAWKLRTKRPNHIWGMDFIGETTRRGRRLRIFNVIEQFTRVALACRVDNSIGTRTVIEDLAPVFDANGKPKIIPSDKVASSSWRL